MLLLYKNAASMPDIILAIEELQKKSKRIELPILDIKLAMYALTSVLQLGDYKKEWTNEKDTKLPRKPGLNESRPTWPHMPGASTANARVPRTNHSADRPIWLRSGPHMM